MKKRMIYDLNLIIVYWNFLLALSMLESTREMSTSFRRNDVWDRLGGQALLVIGYWLP